VRCPNPTCRSARISNLNTWQPDDAGIIAELRGLNITRRRKKCGACNEVFFTVECDEKDFLHLRRKTGRLEVSQPSVRPGMTK